ncbi:MAG: hypothetical protein ACYCZF_07810 [Anaerolineae bacterium]
MDIVELRLAALVERLARENRQLLAMLRLGYTLKRAERILAHPKAPRTHRGIPRSTAEKAED